MNPYEVLGVRPTASLEEIELAYKGRRSQYHPDRYQRSDAETIRWATTKMQEINDAYATLSDAQRREHWDATSSNATEQRSREQKSGADKGGQPSLESLLAEVQHTLKGSKRIFLKPSIPMKKLSPALMSYGQGVDADDVLVLVDTTMMGGAKEGMMFTERALLSKEFMGSACAFPWADMRRMEVSGTKVFLNTRPFMECTLVEEPELAHLFKAVQRHVEIVGKSSRPPEPTRAEQSAAQHAKEDRRVRLEQLFQATKDSLIEFCAAIEQFKSDEQQFIDRDNAVDYFDGMQGALRRWEHVSEIEAELALIGELCEAWQLIREDLYHVRFRELECALEDDSQLVGELRQTLRRIRRAMIQRTNEMEQAAQQSQRRARVDSFFRR